MTTVGVRELKAKLSYYLQLMQAGEEIAIKVHNCVVGYLSKSKKTEPKKSSKETLSKKKVEQLFKQWEKEGYLRRATHRMRPITPIKMTPGPTSTEMIREMRDEE